MPFGCCPVQCKERLHFNYSVGNVYAGFLLPPHLSHLCCAPVNLREAKREIFTILQSLLCCSPHCPRAQLLAAGGKPPRAHWLPKPYFQPVVRSPSSLLQLCALLDPLQPRAEGSSCTCPPSLGLHVPTSPHGCAAEERQLASPKLQG